MVDCPVDSYPKADSIVASFPVASIWQAGNPTTGKVHHIQGATHTTGRLQEVSKVISHSVALDEAILLKVVEEFID